MRYKAVLFDLGGTLVKTADIPEIFRRILETFGFRVEVGTGTVVGTVVGVPFG